MNDSELLTSHQGPKDIASRAAIATVKHTCWESYRRIGDKTMVALRRVPIASCASTSPSPHHERRSRGLFKATAGECDELETSCQHGMNGDGLMNTIRTCSKLYEQDTPNIAVTRLPREKIPCLPRAPLCRRDRMLSIRSNSILVASTMSQCKVQIVYLGPSLSRLSAAGRVLMCVGIRTPRKNSFLVDRIPGVQWVILVVLGWHLTSSQSWNSKRPRNDGGFVHSPAFLKQRPESAMNQNTTWHEWCCIALPKRIRTKRALCKFFEQLPSTDAIAYCLPFPHNTGGIDDEPISGHNGLMPPCLGIRTPRKNSPLVDQIPDVQWVILIILDSHLTSFEAWQLDRHRDELMFQSGSWRASPIFVDEQAVKGNQPDTHDATGHARRCIKSTVRTVVVSLDIRWLDLMPKHAFSIQAELVNPSACIYHQNRLLTCVQAVFSGNGRALYVPYVDCS
ncbi:hypothetical protein MYU51_018713 [Penicillium brevicompactum]